METKHENKVKPGGGKTWAMKPKLCRGEMWVIKTKSYGEKL
jgi:hypothetical protein